MNRALSSFDAVLVGASTAEAMLACVVHVKVRKVSSQLNRALSLGIACLALLYAAAYQFLMWTQIDPGDFQQVLRGMGIVAWLLVWTAPYVALLKGRRQLSHLLVAAVERELRTE